MWKRLAGLLGLWKGLLWVERWLGWRRQLIVVTYHHVSDPSSSVKPLSGLQSGIHPQLFAEQIETLCKWYQPIAMATCADIVNGTTPLRKDAFVVTFDDAYCSVLEQAIPILERHGIWGHVFVSTGYIESPHRFWWVRAIELMHQATQETWKRLWEASDDWAEVLPEDLRRYDLEDWGQRRAASQAFLAALDELPPDEQDRVLGVFERELPPPVDSLLPLLSWHELRELNGRGHSFGGHTHRHPRLGRLAVAEVDRDLAASNMAFQQHIAIQPTTFAYPQGDFNAETPGRVAAAGYQLAFTTQHGCISGAGDDRYRLPRTCMGSRAKHDLLARLAWIKMQKYFPCLNRRRKR